MRTRTLPLIALATGGCELGADGVSAIRESQEYSFIMDRMTEACDGNLLVIGSGNVIEIRDGAKLSPDVTFSAASEADKLNRPGFVGTYVVELKLPDETPYRYIIPDISVSDWTADRTEDDAFRVDAVRYAPWTEGYREEEPLLRFTIDSFETHNEIRDIRNQQNFYLGWDDITFSSSMTYDQDDFSPMDSLQFGNGFATAEKNFNERTSQNRQAWIDALSAGAPFQQTCDIFRNVYYATASVFLGQETDAVFRRYVTSKYFSEDLIGVSDSKEYIRHIAASFGVDLSDVR